MPEILEVRDLTKVFNRRIRAVHNLSLSIYQGEIFAFLGPNGAGKTTSLKMFCGLARPTSGEVRLAGISLRENREEYLGGLGLVSQHFNVDTDLSAEENMMVHGLLHRWRGEVLKKRVASLLEFAGLTEYDNVPVRNFSGGMRRKLQIVRAILHKPKMIFLDEPTVGLDAHSREKIWGLIKGLNKEGKTIFFSTHYIEEAENYADRVGIIHRGELIRVDTPEALIEELGPWCRETFSGGFIKRRHFRSREEAEGGHPGGTEEGYAGAEQRHPGGTAGGTEEGYARGHPGGTEEAEGRAGSEEAIGNSRGYQRLVVRRTQLEDVFIHLTGEEALS